MEYVLLTHISAFFIQLITSNLNNSMNLDLGQAGLEKQLNALG